MAYERVWTFAPQLNNTPPDWFWTIVWNVWTLKSLLVGSWSGATAGRWTVMGSNDGVTAAMDGVDRWPSAASLASGPTCWIVLRSPQYQNGLYVYALLTNNGSPGNMSAPVTLSYTPFTGGTTSSNPSASGSGQFFTSSFSAPTCTRFYGALSANGDAWFVGTAGGFAAWAVVFVNPVGAKPIDVHPFYSLVYASSGSSNVTDGTVLFSGAYAPTKRYNGTAGWSVLNQPGMQKAVLDVADTSIFDFPAWVFVLDNTTMASATTVHSRGRLPDIGIMTGAVSANPVGNGNVIRDTMGNIKYVTCGALMLPYNNSLV